MDYAEKNAINSEAESGLNDEPVVSTRHELNLKVAKLKMLIQSGERRMNGHHRALMRLRHVDEFEETRSVISRLTHKIVIDNQ